MTWRIGTWNLENLFLPGGDSGPRTQPEYDAKLDTLAATITGLDLDVLALQEVGDPAALDDLVQRLAAAGGGTYAGELSNAPDDRGIRVGVLSRFPVMGRAEVVDLPAPLSGGRIDDEGGRLTRMGRGALSVMVDAPGGPMVMITCHLKSKLLSYPGGRFSPRSEDERARAGAYAVHRRAVEAATVRYAATRVLDGEGQQRRLVVAGDLNDTPLAATTQIVLGPGGSEIGTPGADQPDKGDGQRLWNLEPLMPEGQDWSRVSRGSPELIDHLLVSHSLLAKVRDARAVVPSDLASVGDDPRPRRDEPASDHAPVIATLDD